MSAGEHARLALTRRQHGQRQRRQRAHHAQALGAYLFGIFGLLSLQQQRHHQGDRHQLPIRSVPMPVPSLKTTGSTAMTLLPGTDGPARGASALPVETEERDPG